jgi:hypothetical protein
LRGVDARQALEIVENVGWFAPVVLVPQLLSLSAETLAWQCVFSRLDRPLRFRSLLGIRVVTEAIGRTFPAGALLCESVKPSLLYSRCGVPVPDALAAMAGRKFLVLLSHAAYITIALIAGFAELAHASRAFGYAPALGLALGVAAIALLGSAVFMVSAFRNGVVAQATLRILLAFPVPALRTKLTTALRSFLRRRHTLRASIRVEGG